jgi:hypothetical protein
MSIVEEMDEAILKATGRKPAEYDLQGLFNECQTYQQTLYGGGEKNRAEFEWIEGIKSREAEISDRRTHLIEETDEVEELEVEETKVEETKVEELEVEETKVEALDDLVRDGIIIRR